MEKIKKILYFINAHRDGCTGRLVEESLNLSKEELMSTFRQMYNEGLICFANMESETLTDEDISELLVMISGAYSHPDYSNIF
jgi:hypothetical protein